MFSVFVLCCANDPGAPASAQPSDAGPTIDTMRFRLGEESVEWQIVYQPQYFRIARADDDSFNNLAGFDREAPMGQWKSMTENEGAFFVTTQIGRRLWTFCAGSGISTNYRFDENYLQGTFTGILRDCTLPLNSPNSQVELRVGEFRVQHNR